VLAGSRRRDRSRQRLDNKKIERVNPITSNIHTNGIRAAATAIHGERRVNPHKERTAELTLPRQQKDRTGQPNNVYHS